MALSLDQAAAIAGKLHTAAETALARDGSFTGSVALILPDARVSAVLPFGPDGAPPSDEFIVKHAAQRGAAGLALTGEYWVDLSSVTPKQAALDPADVPQPSHASGERRGEQIITTVVVRRQSQVVRYRTPINRTVFGVRLGERVETRDEPVMPGGEAQRLAAVLDRAAVP